MAHRHTYEVNLEDVEPATEDQMTDGEREFYRHMQLNGCGEITDQHRGWIKIVNQMHPHCLAQNRCGELCPHGDGTFMVRWMTHEEAVEAEAEFKKIWPNIKIYEGG